MTICVGTAGWSILKAYDAQFPAGGSHLERYAQRLNAVEINTSFYRPHRPATYARWAAAVPADFQFAVKVPRTVTHEHRLNNVAALDAFRAETAELGGRLGPWLVQLPPSLPFNSRLAGAFFAAVRERFDGAVTCEPRHASWFAPEAARLLERFRVARVAADPAPHPLAAEPAGWDALVYYRQHGSPLMYRSAYSAEHIAALARKLTAAAARGAAAWCIFDNTAEFAALGNALQLSQLLAG
jgi:uncharacterized protein YecE (DUF72 family)